MNRIAMVNYIYAWEGNTDETEERLDAMTDTELTEYFELLYNACEGQVPPPGQHPIFCVNPTPKA